MTTIDDRPTVGDRYIAATSSADLTLTPGRSDADMLLAAGYAARNNRRGMLALTVWRMRSSDDRAGFGVVADTAADWLVGRAARTRHKLSRGAAQAIAVRTLGWYVDERCPACEGRKYERVRGTPHLSATLCRACHGTGRPPIEEVSPRYTEHVRWLATEFDALCGYIAGDMARRLNVAMDLAG